jgi:hypothetical protein
MLLNDIYDRLNPRPWTRGYQVVPPRGVAPLVDLMICHHESAHCLFYYLNGLRVHDVTVAHGEGRGQFRSAPDATTFAPPDTPEAGAELISMMVATRDPETHAEWIHHLVAWAVGKAAQRKFGATHKSYDDYCYHDYVIINRVLDAITRDPERKAKYLRQVEYDAELFVHLYWNEICKLAAEIYRHGTLDKRQIEAVLGKRGVALNQSAADFADDLVQQGKINWGGFTWDSDLDYDLASSDDDDDDGEVQVHYPFGRDGEVYVQALKAALKEDGVIGEYAAKLLKDITTEKAQSEANTTKPRAWGRALPRRPGDEENFFRRVDGYFK